MEVFVEAFEKLRVTTWSTSEYRCDGYETNLTETQLHPQIHCSTLYDTRKWKHLKRPSADEWVKETHYICRRGHHSITRSNHAILTRNEAHSVMSHKLSKKLKDAA